MQILQINSKLELVKTVSPNQFYKAKRCLINPQKLVSGWDWDSVIGSFSPTF